METRRDCSDIPNPSSIHFSVQSIDRPSAVAVHPIVGDFPRIRMGRTMFVCSFTRMIVPHW